MYIVFPTTKEELQEELQNESLCIDCFEDINDLNFSIVYDDYEVEGISFENIANEGYLYVIHNRCLNE